MTTESQGLALVPPLAPLSRVTAAIESFAHSLVYVDLHDLANNRPPARVWCVESFVPAGMVSTLFGKAGSLKTFAMIDLAIHTVLRRRWLGQNVSGGGVLGIFCEEDENELKRRVITSLEGHGISLSTPLLNLWLVPRAGMDNALVETVDGRLEPTAFYDELEAAIAESRPVLVIIDNLAQVFAGVENDRHDATVFCNLLTRWAIKYGCAVILVGHTAKAEGSEWSGSTAWEAAVRSRLFLERRQDGLIELHIKKSNYAALTSTLFEYKNGALLHSTGDGQDSAGAHAAQSAIIKALEHYTAAQVATNNRRGAANHIAKLMEVDGLLADCSLDAARRAVDWLVSSGVLTLGALPWRKSDRHTARGLVFAEAV